MCKFCTNLWTTLENMFVFRFHEQQIEALAIPVSLTSAKQRRKSFLSCLILNIKLSSINSNWWATFTKKTAFLKLRWAHRCSRAASVIGQCTLGSYWVSVDVCVAYSPRAHGNSEVTALFTWNYECYPFIGRWDSLSLECFFSNQKNIYHTFIVVWALNNYLKPHECNWNSDVKRVI